MLKSATTLLSLILSLGFSSALWAQNEKPGTYADPEVAAKADPDFAVQGEYEGEAHYDDGSMRKFGMQVIALGDGKFEATGYPGGLPGQGYKGKGKVKAAGERKDGAVVLTGAEGSGTLENGVITLLDKGSKKRGELKKVSRESPTLGEKPPQGAVVLFDGKGVDHWKGGRMTDDGLLMEGTTSNDTFQSQQVHIEFRLPYQPAARGQGRGNSGIYLQGRYEVQMLDSFGLDGKDNESGGIYSIKAPDLNMCLPPLVWQTYDIDFTAAKYDADGKLAANPRITVRHNGVVVQKDVELPHSTTAAPVKPGPEPGPIYLQNHNNPVRYRNVWVVPASS